MKLKGKSVMVVSGAGFIGSHIVDAIIRESPSNLVVVDNFFLGKESNLQKAKDDYPNLIVYRNDATDYVILENIIKNNNIEVVFNLAVIPLLSSLTEPLWGFYINIKITANLCELIRKGSYDTLIHFSSSEVYGTTEYAPMNEKHPLNGTTPYAASKTSSDLLILSYCRTFGIDASIIRPFNNYGERQNDRSYAGVIPVVIKRIMNGESPIIYGDGKQSRDYIYVKDTAEASILIYNNESTRKKAVNIASGSEITINTLVKSIMAIMGFDGDIIYKSDRPGDVRRHIANTFQAVDLLGFEPKTSFDVGLKKTVEWYIEYFNKMDVPK